MKITADIARGLYGNVTIDDASDALLALDGCDITVSSWPSFSHRMALKVQTETSNTVIRVFLTTEGVLYAEIEEGED